SASGFDEGADLERGVGDGGRAVDKVVDEGVGVEADRQDDARWSLDGGIGEEDCRSLRAPLEEDGVAAGEGAVGGDVPGEVGDRGSGARELDGHSVEVETVGDRGGQVAGVGGGVVTD